MGNPFDYLSNQEILTLVLVLGITFVLTERVKDHLRASVEPKKKPIPFCAGDAAPRLVSFVMGFGLVYLAWPASSHVDAWLMGLFIGLGAPALYKLVKWKFPKLAKAITGKKP